VKRFIAAVLCFLLSPLPGTCEPPADQHYAGRISALIPSATRNAKPTQVKDDLEWNDLLKTEHNGRLRAGLADGSILSLGSDSELRVLQHDAASQQTSMEMSFGKVRSQVVKITQPNGKYEMKTPNAVIGVIGTDFFVGYEANKTTVICYRGQVSVTPSGNAKVVKNSGQQDASSNSIMVSAGQMVVISDEIPPEGFQTSVTPPALQLSTIRDTTVDGEPIPPVHSHVVRNVVLGVAVAATGWAVGITQLKGAGGAPPAVPVCNPNAVAAKCPGTGQPAP
jgi:FecR protein